MVFINREAIEEEIEQMGLKHRVYYPIDLGRDRPVLVVLVHGKAGNDQVMWAFARLFRDIKAVIVSPEAPYPDPQGGWSWWLSELNQCPTDVSHEVLGGAVNVLGDFVAKFVGYHGLDPRLVVGMGFSQGAAVLSSLAICQPQLCHLAILLAGFVPDLVLDQLPRHQKVSQNIQPSFFIAHGSLDNVIPLESAELGCSVLRSAGYDVEMVVDDVGHKVGVNAQKCLRSWIEGKDSVIVDRPDREKKGE